MVNLLREYIRSLFEADFGEKFKPDKLNDPTGIERHAPEEEAGGLRFEPDTEEERNVYQTLWHFLMGGQSERQADMGKVAGQNMDMILQAMDDPKYNDVFARYPAPGFTSPPPVRGSMMSPERLDKILPQWRTMVYKYRKEDPQKLGFDQKDVQRGYDVENEEPYNWGDESEFWSDVQEVNYTYMSRAVGGLSHWTRDPMVAHEFALGDYGGKEIGDRMVPVILYAAPQGNDFLDVARLYQYKPFNRLQKENEIIGFGPIKVVGVEIYLPNYADLGKKVTGTRKDFKEVRQYIRALLNESGDTSNNAMVEFIVRSNQIEGYDVDPGEVREAIDGIEAGYPLTYVTNNPHIYSHLAGIEAAKGGVGSVGDIVKIHGAMGAGALDAGAPGVLRSGVEAQSAGGTQYVPSEHVPEALSWWSKQGWGNPFEAHTVYELIHPFADGNGRSGRIILAAMMGFNYDAVNGLIGGGYFSNLDSVGSKYQGEFWRDDSQLREHVRALLREAEAEGVQCPIRGAWYGGMPAGGGFQPHKEYTVAAQRYAEAGHCILGSLGRRMGAEGKSEWHSMVGSEREHLLEEIGIMQQVMAEYSNDLYIGQFNDLSQYREEFREETAEYSEGAIADIKKTSPRLEEKATANLHRLIAIKEAEPEFPDSVYKVALYTYQCLGLLARAMLASIEGWDENKQLDHRLNAFKDPKLATRTDLLESAIDEMIQDLS